MMRLQINDSGAWRHVLSFPEGRWRRARLLTEELADLAHGSVKLRITDEQGSVSAYWLPDQGWVNPAWAKEVIE